MPLTRDERSLIELELTSLKSMLDGVTEQTGGTEPNPTQDMVGRILPSAPAGGVPTRAPGEDDAHFQARLARYNNLIRDEQGTQAQTFNGSSGVRAKDTTPADRVYLAHAQRHAQERLGPVGEARNQDIYQLLLVGTMAQINAAKDVRSHDDAKGEVSQFDAHPGDWTKRYAATGSKIERAFHAWLTVELAK